MSSTSSWPSGPTLIALCGWWSMRSREVAVILEDPKTGMTIQQQSGLTVRHEFTCGAGQVRVVGTGLPAWDAYNGLGRYARSHGRVEKLVKVMPGRTVKVSLEVPIGGVLDVEVRGEVSELDTARVGEEVDRRARLGDAEVYTDIEALLRATITLEDPVRHVVETVTPERGSIPRTDSYTRPDAHLWTLGETHRSGMLPSGTYTPRAIFPNRAPIETQVTIRSGEVTPVVLDFGD
ncbi:MAG: hypothetical protein ACI80K_001215 [Paracoccaceae bacterium]|jgi:hypothetical protein